MSARANDPRAILKKRWHKVDETPLTLSRFYAIRAIVNNLQRAMRAQWRAQMYRRNGPKKLHRTAIISGVTSYANRRGSTLSGMVGISRKKRHAAIVNVIDPGFRNRLAGRYITGKHVKREVMRQADLAVVHYQAIAEKSLASMLSGNTGKVRFG